MDTDDGETASRGSEDVDKDGSCSPVDVESLSLQVRYQECDEQDRLVDKTFVSTLMLSGLSSADLQSYVDRDYVGDRDNTLVSWVDISRSLMLDRQSYMHELTRQRQLPMPDMKKDSKMIAFKDAIDQYSTVTSNIAKESIPIDHSLDTEVVITEAKEYNFGTSNDGENYLHVELIHRERDQDSDSDDGCRHSPESPKPPSSGSSTSPVSKEAEKSRTWLGLRTINPLRLFRRDLESAEEENSVPGVQPIPTTRTNNDTNVDETIVLFYKEGRIKEECWFYYSYLAMQS